MATYSLTSHAFDDEEKFALLATSPASGDLRLEFGDGIRSAAAGRFVIFYREESYGVLILRVLAGDRDIKRL